MRWAVTATLLAATACGFGGAAGPGCTLVGGPTAFPEALEESSGVAWSLRHPGVAWTAGDGRIGSVFAIDSLGSLIAEVPVDLPGVWDVEDLSVAACDAGSCLYFADTGDNALRRDTVLVHRLPEPALEGGPEGGASVPAEALRLRLPAGPDDIEAMFVGRDGVIRFVSKGSGRPPALYRVPPEAGPDSTRLVAFAQRLDSTSRYLGAQITGASAVPGTDRVVIRTYEDLQVWELRNERLIRIPGEGLDLGTLQEPQGEAVAVDARGRVLLTSEAGPLGRRGGAHLLRCTGLPAG